MGGTDNTLHIPRGAHLRVGIRLTTEFLDPNFDYLADDYGYAFLDIIFCHDGNSLGNYFLLARNNNPVDGTIGAPPKLEQYLRPGREEFDRVQNSAWIVRDIDLDALGRARFDPNRFQVSQFNGIAFELKTFDVQGKSNEFRKRVDLDFLEVYVPATTNVSRH